VGDGGALTLSVATAPRSARGTSGTTPRCSAARSVTILERSEKSLIRGRDASARGARGARSVPSTAPHLLLSSRRRARSEISVDRSNATSAPLRPARREPGRMAPTPQHTPPGHARPPPRTDAVCPTLGPVLGGRVPSGRERSPVLEKTPFVLHDARPVVQRERLAAHRRGRGVSAWAHFYNYFSPPALLPGGGGRALLRSLAMPNSSALQLVAARRRGAALPESRTCVRLSWAPCARAGRGRALAPPLAALLHGRGR